MHSNERIDDLQIDGLRLIQDKTKYCFTSDSVLLANLVKCGVRDKILDIGTGTGIVAILLAGKKKASSVTAVEIQEDLSKLAERNVKLNKLDGKVTVVNASAQSLMSKFGAERFDIIVSNPPYRKPCDGQMDLDEGRAICKYEIKLSLDELTNIAASLLKYKGKFYMVHRADRMCECIYLLKQNKLEPKIVTLVYPKAGKAPDTVIYECVKGGAAGVKINSLVVYADDGEYTAAAKKLYAKE